MWISGTTEGPVRSKGTWEKERRRSSIERRVNTDRRSSAVVPSPVGRKGSVAGAVGRASLFM